MVIKFYQLYYPDYPECLVLAIANRIDGIIEKSRKGAKLDEAEKGYVVRSKQESRYWDPKEELDAHQKAG